MECLPCLRKTENLDQADKVLTTKICPQKTCAVSVKRTEKVVAEEDPVVP